MGLKVKLMPRAVATPLSPAKTHTYTFQRGSETWKSEMYSPHELWVRSQHEGRWQDQDTNVLKLATIRFPFPGPFEREHVTREAYEKAVADVQKTPTAWNAETITKWVVDFTGASDARSQTVQGRFFRLKNLVRFELEGVPRNILAYAFRVKPMGGASGAGSANWRFALCEANPGIPFAKARAAMESGFLSNLSPLTTSSSRSSSLSRSFQAGRKTSDTDRSPEFLASKRTAVESIRNMKGWWHAETRNYIFLSNLGTRHRVMVKDLQRNIELLRSAYGTVLSPRVDIRAVSVVRIFATPEEYINYMGEKHKWSGGMWVAGRKELVIRPIDWGGSKNQRDRVFKVTFHEAFHQYVFYALDQVRTSVWFNEGHAEFFAAARIRNGQVVVEEDKRSWDEIEPLVIAGDVRIKELLKMDYEQFYDEDDEKRRQNYALAWAIVYYLRKGAPLERPPRNADIPKRYVDALWQTKDPVKATETAFAEVTVPGFERAFLAFWRSRNRRSTAKRNRLFTGLALRSRRR